MNKLYIFTYQISSQHISGISNRNSHISNLLFIRFTFFIVKYLAIFGIRVITTSVNYRFRGRTISKNDVRISDDIDICQKIKNVLQCRC